MWVLNWIRRTRFELAITHKQKSLYSLIFISNNENVKNFLNFWLTFWKDDYFSSINCMSADIRLFYVARIFWKREYIIISYRPTHVHQVKIKKFDLNITGILHQRHHCLVREPQLFRIARTSQCKPPHHIDSHPQDARSANDQFVCLWNLPRIPAEEVRCAATQWKASWDTSKIVHLDSAERYPGRMFFIKTVTLAKLRQILGMNASEVVDLMLAMNISRQINTRIDE